EVSVRAPPRRPRSAVLDYQVDGCRRRLNLSSSSGTLRLRVSNARTYGLTENERREVRLTSLDRRNVPESACERPAIGSRRRLPAAEQIRSEPPRADDPRCEGYEECALSVHHKNAEFAS